MLVPVPGTAERRYQCLGPALFAERLETPEFSMWFKPLEEALQELKDRETGSLERLSILQNWLVDLLEIFDPGKVTLAGHSRRRLEVNSKFAHLAPPGAPAATG